MQGIRPLLHAAGAINFGYSVYYDLMFVHAPPHLRGKFEDMSAFPGKWKYLTFWNMVLQCLYHCLALLNDFVGSSEVSPKRQTGLQKIRDHLFASWVFPAGMFVSLSFWILYGIDRALVFPKELDLFFPNWLNHAVHTAPILLMLVEAYVVPMIYPSTTVIIAGNLFFSCSYISWVYYVNHVAGVWAYPILTILNEYQRAGFMLACATAILSCLVLGRMLNKSRWSKGKGQESKSYSTANKGGKSTKGKRKAK